MCILLKLDYAKCGVSNLIFQSYGRKTFGVRLDSLGKGLNAGLLYSQIKTSDLIG